MLQPYSRIGSNVGIWSANHIGHYSTIADNPFLISHLVIFGHCPIGRKSFLGVNATWRDGITLGEAAFGGMAAAVTRDTLTNTVVKGNSGEIMKISSDCLER
jgi:acetyltransferase-like isoleucine patch superfamily enzyme